MSNGVVAGQDSREGIYLEIYEDHQGGDFELGLVTTEIRGDVDGPRTIEEGVVRKSVEVRQSTRFSQPAS